MAELDYAVIIPHFNDVERLSKCLGALTRHIDPEVGIYVVDNGSSVPLEGIKQRYPQVRFLTEGRPGAANARNTGVASTREKYLLFIDADCIPDAAWIVNAKRCAKANAITGGRITVFDETSPPRTGSQAFEAVFAFNNERYVREMNFSVTANMVTNREVFERVGPMRHGFSEDLDWCHRAVAAGYAISYDANLLVSHPSRGDWQALRKKWLRLTKEAFEVNGQSQNDRIRWGLKALAMPLSILVHARAIYKSDALVQGEQIRALSTLARLRLTRMSWMLRQAAGRNI